MPGSHSLAVYAVDLAGNRSKTIRTTWLARDLTAPVLTWVARPASSGVASSVAVTVRASEALSAASVILDGKVVASWSKLAAGTTTVGTTLRGLKVGAHSVTVSVKDTAGNASSTSYKFTVRKR